MRVGQELEKGLIAPAGAERSSPTVFLKAADDAPKTIKSATGSSIAKTLKEAGLTPKEMSAIDRVSRSLRQDAEFDALVNSTSSQGASNAAAELAPQFPKMLQAETTVANAISLKLSKTLQDDVSKEAGAILRDPKKFKALLEKISPRVSTIAPAAVTIPITAEMNR